MDEASGKTYWGGQLPSGDGSYGNPLSMGASSPNYVAEAPQSTTLPGTYAVNEIVYVKNVKLYFVHTDLCADPQCIADPTMMDLWVGSFPGDHSCAVSLGTSHFNMTFGDAHGLRR